MNFDVTQTIIVNASPEDVFDVLTDIARLTEWNREIRAIHERPATLAPGAQWTVEIHAMGTHWRSRSTVVGYDRAAGVFTYRSQTDDGNPSSADWVWRVARHDRGAEVRVDVSVRPRTFWRRHLLSTMRKRGLTKAVDVSLAALHDLCTSSPTTPSTKGIHHEPNHQHREEVDQHARRGP